MRWKMIGVGALLAQSLVVAAAGAVEGPAPGALSAQTLKLPDGPGSLRGLAKDPSVSTFSGQVSYEVPLELPGSRRDFRPQLALAYRGDLGNGPLGVGWALRGVAIRRSTRLGTPHFDATDELELSGIGASGRLVAAGDGTFRVEGRGNEVKIVAEAGGYRVFDGSGTQYRLGQSAGARQSEGARVVAWMAEEVTDSSGQRVTYAYQQDRGQIYLSSVSWGPGDVFRAVFELADRPDVTTSYREGIPVVSGRRIAAIRVEAFGEVLRRYELGYEQSFALSRLSSVRMLGRGGVGSLPPLSFSYASTRTPEIVAMTGLDGWRLNARGVTLVDVDGDGASDLLRIEPGNHMYRRNLGDGSFGSPVAITGADASGLDAARLMDVEGRARPNLVTVNAGSWSPYRLSGQGWTAIGAWTGTAGVPIVGSDVVMADLNGDGRIDVVQWNPVAMQVRFGNATGLGAPVAAPLIAGAILPGADVQWVDVNGDGLADAVQLTTQSMNVFYGRGDGTFTPREQVAYPANAAGLPPARLRLGDLNRDGLIDLVVVSSTAVDFYAGRPSAQLFSPQAVRLAGPEDAGVDVVIAIADANGNGSEDVVWSSPRGSWLLDLAGSTAAGMLTGVQNGMGKSLRIEYAASATLARDAGTAGQPWARALQVSIPVAVRTVLTLAAGEPARVTDYEVRDGFWDDADFTFGGFLVGREIARGGSPARDLVTETSYHSGTGVSRVLRGKPVTVTRSSGDGRVFDVSTFRWRAMQVGDLGADPLLKVAAVTESWADHFEGGSVAVRTHKAYVIDDQGRAVRESDDGRLDLVGDEKVTERSFASDAGLWVRDRLYEEKVTGPNGVLVSDVRSYYGDATTTLPLGTIGRGWKRRSDGWLATGASRWVTLEATEYDLLGNVVSTRKDGVTRALGYDSLGLHVVSETVAPDADHSLVWSGQWDNVQGVPVVLTDPAGAITHLGYDSVGRLSSMALGTAPPHVYFQYDWERPDPRTITFRFDGDAEHLPPSLPAWASGNGWRQSIDVMNGNSELVSKGTRLADGAWLVDELRQHDARGAVIFRAEPFFFAGTDLPSAAPAGTAGTRLEYDAIGRRAAETLPSGARRLSSYGIFTVRVETTDLGPVTSFYDGRDRVVRTERSVGSTTEATSTRYDAADRVVAFDTGGVISSFSYDSLGRLVASSDPDGGARRLVYDDGNHLVEHHNGEGQHVAFAYDGAGRLVEQRTDDASALRFHYDRPRAGSPLGFQGARLAWAEDAEGTVDLAYDGSGRPTIEHRVIRGVSAEVAHAYGASGLVRRVAYDDGFAYDVTSDAAGRPVSIPGIWQADGLDAAGRPLAEHFGNGVQQVTERDVLGLPTHVRVTDASGAGLYDVSAARASYGSLVRLTDNDGVGLDHGASFSYDGAARLTHATLGSTYQFDYAYDGLQNMVARKLTGPALANGLYGSYRYGELGAGPRQLTSVEGSDATFRYDLAGRQLQETGSAAQVFAYNGLDQLLSVVAAAGTTRHSYGWNGQRALTQEPDGSIWRWFSSSLVERDGLRDHYVSIGDRVVARIRTPVITTAGIGVAILGALPPALAGMALLFVLVALMGSGASERRRLLAASATALVLAGPLGATGCSLGDGGVAAGRHALENGQRRLYFHQGFAPGPSLFTDDAGALVEERRFEPFGEDIDAFRPETGTSRVDFQAEPTGALAKPVDPATRLSFHGARWFSADSARWLTPDPPTKAPDVKFATTPWNLHPYAYVNQNPVTYWDPDGRASALVDYSKGALETSDLILTGMETTGLELPSVVGYAASFATVGGATTLFGIGMVIASPALNLFSIGDAYQQGLNQLRDARDKSGYAEGLMASYFYSDYNQAKGHWTFHGVSGNDQVNAEDNGHNQGFIRGFADGRRQQQKNPDGAAQFFGAVVGASAHEEGSGAQGTAQLLRTQQRAAKGQASDAEREDAVFRTFGTVYKMLNKDK